MSSIKETAEEIVTEWSDAHQVDNVGPGTKARLVADIEQALRDRDERAAKIIEDHRAQDVCRDNCWTTITAAIRKGD